MLFTDITSLISQVRFELGSIADNYTDSDLTTLSNYALVILNKILKGYYTEQVTLPVDNNIITIDSTKEVYFIEYTNDSGNYVKIDKADFIQINDQLQVSLPSYVSSVNVYCVKQFTIDDMPNETIQLAFIYLMCDLAMKKLANSHVGIKSIADGIMNITYDNELNSPDQSKYMKLFYNLIYKETSFLQEVNNE